LPKKYPILACKEVLAILAYWGFVNANQVGSHAQYVTTIKNKKRRVTVDMSLSEFDDFLLHSMINQSGLTREEFYLCTKATAKKINGRFTDYKKVSTK
jgi:predicted RNA binding protein YcfA (HicA-like mRNA interferase family)